MPSKIFRVASIAGALAVTLGAFGAHALNDHLMLNGSLATYKTAVLYHFIHSLLLVLIAISPLHNDRAKGRLAYMIVAGMVCFSGSLYILSTFRWSWVGPITPIGGLLLVVSWVYAAATARRPS